MMTVLTRLGGVTSHAVGTAEMQEECSNGADFHENLGNVLD